MWSEQTHTWKTNDFSLLEEDGIYSEATSSAIRLFRLSFNMAANSKWQLGNTNVNFTFDPNGNVAYKIDDPNVTIYGLNDNTTNIFRKLMKDYNHRGTVQGSRDWADKIIDKETLIGKDRLIPDLAPTVTTDNADVELNRATNRHDTGLYELYKNVVERFIDRMIKEAERYAGLRNDMGELPISDWVSRPNQNSPGIDKQHDPQYLDSGRRGMSYSYGGRQKIEDFNKFVADASVEAFNRGVVTNCTTTISEEKDLFLIGSKGIGWVNCQGCHLTPAFSPDTKISSKTLVYTTTVDGNYQGNVSHNSCAIGGGYQKYPGLKLAEYESNGVDSAGSYTLINFFTGEAFGTTTVYPQFEKKYWAGTDCSSLVGRSVEAAKNNIPWISVAISSALYSGDYCAIEQNSESEDYKLV